jgi:hypothetical protein
MQWLSADKLTNALYVSDVKWAELKDSTQLNIY